MQPNGTRVVIGDPLDRPGQRHSFTACTIAGPVRYHIRHGGRIAEHADMRPAIAKADERVWMTQHLTDCVEIAIGVVAEWAVKNARTLPFQQYVVDKLFRIAPFARRPRRNALLRRRFIIWHIAIPGKDALVG